MAAPTIYPFLWMDTQAEEAMNFYLSLFPNSKVLNVSRWGEGGPVPAGTAMVVSFEINGQKLAILNGGPTFKLSEAISLVVNCDTQADIDRYWDALAEGGMQQQCGWVKDRFGLSWQIVPTRMGELMGTGTPEQCGRAMQAMLGMKKLDIAAIERARGEA